MAPGTPLTEVDQIATTLSFLAEKPKPLYNWQEPSPTYNCGEDILFSPPSDPGPRQQVPLPAVHG